MLYSELRMGDANNELNVTCVAVVQEATLSQFYAIASTTLCCFRKD